MRCDDDLPEHCALTGNTSASLTLSVPLRTFKLHFDHFEPQQWHSHKSGPSNFEIDEEREWKTENTKKKSIFKVVFTRSIVFYRSVVPSSSPALNAFVSDSRESQVSSSLPPLPPSQRKERQSKNRKWKKKQKIITSAENTLKWMRNRNESSRDERGHRSRSYVAGKHDCVAVPLAELFQRKIYIKLVFSSAASYVFASEQKSHKKNFNIHLLHSHFVLVNGHCVAIEHIYRFSMRLLCVRA